MKIVHLDYVPRTIIDSIAIEGEKKKFQDVGTLKHC